MKAAETPPKPAVTRSVVMGTAGHIDHGKTALVLALTGTDTDKLPEEKTRGITIDLGFAALDLEDVDGRIVHLGLVDVPGHHAFIHNMLAGAGGIDCVMLVVAADEGVKAQTIEHLKICTLLGLHHGIIVLTKQDAVTSERLYKAHSEVREFAKGTFLENAPVIAVSSFTGEGIEELRGALVDLALAVPHHSTDMLLRLPLDRAFSIAGFGTVVTGTLRDGSLHPGDAVELQPAGRAVRVRGVQVHHQAVREANAPTRVALNIAGIEVADVRRGDTIIAKGAFSPVSIIDVELTMLPAARILRHRSRVEVYAFTTDSPATILLYDSGQDSVEGLARLRLSKPMLLLPNDRFVLRMPEPAGIIGGGRVLDAHPMRRLRKPQVRQWLNEIRQASTGEQLFARVRRRGIGGISLATLGQESGLRREAISKLLAAPIAASRVISTKIGSPQLDRFLDANALTRAIDLTYKELARRESHSSSRAELLSRTRLSEWVFDLVLGDLTQSNRIHITGSEIALSEANPTAGTRGLLLSKVEELYRAAGLASPLVAEATLILAMAPKEIAPLITLLMRAGKLIRMGSDTLLIHADALAKLKADIGKLRGQTFDVSRFKDFTGLTRKHSIPLLEYLDRLRITVNNQGIRKVL